MAPARVTNRASKSLKDETDQSHRSDLSQPSSVQSILGRLIGTIKRNNTLVLKRIDKLQAQIDELEAEHGG